MHNCIFIKAFFSVWTYKPWILLYSMLFVWHETTTRNYFYWKCTQFALDSGVYIVYIYINIIVKEAKACSKFNDDFEMKIKIYKKKTVINRKKHNRIYATRTRYRASVCSYVDTNCNRPRWKSDLEAVTRWQYDCRKTIVYARPVRVRFIVHKIL